MYDQTSLNHLCGNPKFNVYKGDVRVESDINFLLKDADIIILDGDPFHYNTFVQTTIINGKVLYEKQKSTYFSHIQH